MEFPGITDDASRRRVTFDPSIARDHEDLEFLAIGHEIVDSLLDCCEAREYGDRVSVQFAGARRGCCRTIAFRRPWVITAFHLGGDRPVMRWATPKYRLAREAMRQVAERLPTGIVDPDEDVAVRIENDTPLGPSPLWVPRNREDHDRYGKERRA